MNAAQGIDDEPSNEQPPTILVVDDVVLARMVAASQLRHHGFIVIEVSSADEAIRILDAPVKVDLVFTDVSGATIKATFQQLADAQAIQRQIALAQGQDYVMNTLFDQITALKTYFDTIYESDGDGYTYAEYSNVIEDLREINQISGLL